jgi:hypothetical protein
VGDVLARNEAAAAARRERASHSVGDGNSNSNGNSNTPSSSPDDKMSNNDKMSNIDRLRDDLEGESALDVGAAAAAAAGAPGHHQQVTASGRANAVRKQAITTAIARSVEHFHDEVRQLYRREFYRDTSAEEDESIGNRNEQDEEEEEE